MKLCPNIPNQEFWKNKKVLVTGHTGFKGSWLCLWLLKMGAKVSSTVSKNTDYLISGSDPGSKIQNAEKLKIQIIFEDDLNDFLNNDK